MFVWERAVRTDREIRTAPSGEKKTRDEGEVTLCV